MLPIWVVKSCPSLGNFLAIVGYGSQAAAWSQCLKISGWKTSLYLHRLDGPSAKQAREVGELSLPLAELVALAATPCDDPLPIAFLFPDRFHSGFAEELLAVARRPLRIILATGLLALAPSYQPVRGPHEFWLLAPKAVGPKLAARFLEHAPNTHDLLCAVHCPTDSSREALACLARALGFAQANQVWTLPQKEALGDLISEQILLCGGLFTLLEETAAQMSAAGIDPRIAREECLVELSLIADLLSKKGPQSTLAAISDTAKRGAALFRERLRAAGISETVAAQANEIRSGAFLTRLDSKATTESLRQLSFAFEATERNLS